jgi:predicted ATPase
VTTVVTVLGTSFVGRDGQLGELRARWRAAAAGRGGLVVVGGEAGIGKTRLVEQLAAEVGDGDEAGADDAVRGQVAWGTCAGPDAPPLWPWRAVLRGLARGRIAGHGRRRSARHGPRRHRRHRRRRR